MGTLTSNEDPDDNIKSQQCLDASFGQGRIVTIYRKLWKEDQRLCYHVYVLSASLGVDNLRVELHPFDT